MFIKLLLILLISSNTWGQSRYIDYQSPFHPTINNRGMVVSQNIESSKIGIEILNQGGNAIDAAVATAAALNVLEPMSTGIGGDMFALIWMADTQKVTAINGSGHSAAAANPEDVISKGYSSIPNNGPDAGLAVSVPGTVDGWQECLRRHGTMTLKEVLQPAINYAENGYAVTDVIAYQGAETEAKLKQRPSGSEMLSENKAPRQGDFIKLGTLGKSLRTIAEEGAEGFYKGEIAQKIANYVQSEGGWITEEDLASHSSDWDEPINTTYRDVTVWECPPNGSGIAA